MNSINQVTISGRLGRDIEVRFTPSGKAVAKFSLAVEESYRAAGSQDWTKNTYWIDCELWGKPAEILAADAGKGSLVCVSGRLKTQEWQDKDGKKRVKVFVAVQQAIAAARQRDELDQTAAPEAMDQRPAAAPEDENQAATTQDEMPF